jgi:2,3-bisphosphoglycerate-dependent phosphoglycerate mutase
MLDEIPKSESLKCTLARTSVYWDEVLAPALQEGKTLLIVGHENNLRSLIMRLEGISPEDIINLSLPRAVPLAYKLDENLQPINTRADGSLDEATGLLRGTWLGGDRAVSEILDRDNKQVYDTSITENLEVGDRRDKWNEWMEFLVGKPSPEAMAVGNAAGEGKYVGSAPIRCLGLETGWEENQQQVNGQRVRAGA